MEGFNLTSEGRVEGREWRRNEMDYRQTESINPGVLSTCAWSHLLPLIEEVPHSQQASQEVPECGTAPQLANSTLDVHHGISKLLQDRGGGGGGEGGGNPV